PMSATCRRYPSTTGAADACPAPRAVRPTRRAYSRRGHPDRTGAYRGGGLARRSRPAHLAGRPWPIHRPARRRDNRRRHDAVRHNRSRRHLGGRATQRWATMMATVTAARLTPLAVLLVGAAVCGLGLWLAWGVVPWIVGAVLLGTGLFLLLPKTGIR